MTIVKKIIKSLANFKNKVATIIDVVKIMWDYVGSLPKK